MYSANFCLKSCFWHLITLVCSAVVHLFLSPYCPVVWMQQYDLLHPNVDGYVSHSKRFCFTHSVPMNVCVHSLEGTLSTTRSGIVMSSDTCMLHLTKWFQTLVQNALSHSHSNWLCIVVVLLLPFPILSVVQLNYWKIVRVRNNLFGV